MKQLVMMPLSKLLFRHKDTINIQEIETYKRITIRINNQGIIMRDCVLGSEIGTKKQFIAKSGQLVLSKIDARNSAFGILPKECDGAIITGNFWAFDVNYKLLDTKYFNYLTHTPLFVEFCIKASEGTTNRRYLDESKFLSMQIPLPPLDEQRRIVARIEELAAKVEEARGLRRQSAEEAEVVRGAYLNRLFGSPYTKELGTLGINKFVRLNDVITDVADGPHVTPIYVEKGIPFITVLNITSGKVNFSNLKYISLEEHQQFPKRAKAEKGDVLITKDGTIGIPCFVDTDQEFSFFVSVALVKPKRDVLDGEFLAWAFRIPYLQKRMIERSRGDMIRHLVLREIRDLIVPVPPLSEQRRIVAYLDNLQAKVDALKRLQAETATELDALLPSILDKAFKGEL